MYKFVVFKPGISTWYRYLRYDIHFVYNSTPLEKAINELEPDLRFRIYLNIRDNKILLT